MKKYKYLIFAVIVVIGLIAGYVYFVTGVSSVYPPIKQYQYSGYVGQLIVDIQKYSSKNKSVIFNIIDTVGNEDNGYATYITLSLKSNGRNIEYYLKCENASDNKVREAVIKLVGAYDKSNNIGGYSAEAEGVKFLVEVFDSEFLPALALKLEQE